MRHHWSRSGLTMPLSKYSMGSYPETSSHATCQGTHGHSHLTFSTRWATMDWSWCKEWKLYAHANLHLQKKKKSAGGEWMVEHSPQILASEEKATTIINLKLLCQSILVYWILMYSLVCILSQFHSFCFDVRFLWQTKWFDSCLTRDAPVRQHVERFSSLWGAWWKCSWERKQTTDWVHVQGH